MALDWFAGQGVDYVVLETGLGGRLDSTNIVDPVLSVITNIGLDHCDLLGDTLPEIAFEKAGIIKPEVPVVVGESHPDTDPVFERKVLYTNLPEPMFMGNRNAIMSLLTFADKVQPTMWSDSESILAAMDLQGDYQSKNLRTVMAALDVLLSDHLSGFAGGCGNCRQRDALVRDALIHAASRTGFRGRWEKLSDDPYIICDIGHNEHGLKYNFAQLARMKSEGKCSQLIMVYGSVADKDVDAVLDIMPSDAVYFFTQADSKRALPAAVVRERYLKHCLAAGMVPGDVHAVGRVSDAVALAIETAAGYRSSDPSFRPLIYIGGSTYVVSEAIATFLQKKSI